MENNVLILHFHCKTTLKWSGVPFNKFSITKPCTKFPNFITPSPPHLQLHRRHHHPPNAIPHHNSTKHTTLLVETFHEHQTLKALMQRLSKNESSPLDLLRDDEDWTKDQFWAVIRFLKHASRSNEILRVFDLWKDTEKSRITEFNYEKIIGILCEDGLMEEAVLALQEMTNHGLGPSLYIYNSIIHGFARKGKFEEALHFLNEMKEINFVPDTDTYHRLIEAYGKYQMYDEMGMCVKKMELEGCSPDHITYNLLIREFSHAGLLKRMERVYQIMLSKRMDLQSSTVVAMLEAYSNFGILDKMEKVYRRVLNSKIPLKGDLIRKLAGVYIANYMFSRLDDLGLDLFSRTSRTDLVWCLRFLSHACLLSRKGMDSILREMEEAGIPWNVTVANSILKAYLRMKDFTRLRILLYELSNHDVKPDIVTVGIIFDAIMIGFDGNGVLETWRKMGFLNKTVEMNTDPLVISAFGKGHFLISCEEMYSSLEPETRERIIWTYQSFINLVSKQWKAAPISGN